jgi:hypothetical protein
MRSQKTVDILPWKTAAEFPDDKTLALILINGKITADVFVYFSKQAVFITHSLFEDDVVENKVKLAEVNAWIGLGELPLPVWAAGRA